MYTANAERAPPTCKFLATPNDTYDRPYLGQFGQFVLFLVPYAAVVVPPLLHLPHCGPLPTLCASSVTPNFTLLAQFSNYRPRRLQLGPTAGSAKEQATFFGGEILVSSEGCLGRYPGAEREGRRRKSVKGEGRSSFFVSHIH